MCDCISRMEYYYEKDELRRAFHIGYTVFGTKKWNPQKEKWGNARSTDRTWKYCPFCGKKWEGRQ